MGGLVLFLQILFGGFTASEAGFDTLLVQIAWLTVECSCSFTNRCRIKVHTQVCKTVIHYGFLSWSEDSRDQVVNASSVSVIKRSL